MISPLAPNAGRLCVLWASLLLAAMLVLGDRPARAVTLPAESLATYCRSDSQEEQGVCVGYIMGMIQALTLPPQALPKGSFCYDPQNSITINRFADDLIALIDANPDLGKVPSFQILTNMIMVLYPCGEDPEQEPGEREESRESEEGKDETS